MKYILRYLVLGLFGLRVDAAITWSGPTTVTSGTSYTVLAVDPPGSGYQGGIATTIYKNGAFFASGSPVASASTVDTGNKTVTYTARGWSGAISTRVVTIVCANVAPSGCFDMVTDSLVQGGTLSAGGWAVDSDSTPGAPVRRVDIAIDGASFGSAILGGDRSDVTTAYGRTDYRYSGWDISSSTAALSTGVHTMTVTAVDSSGATTSLGSKNFTISAFTPPSTSLLATTASFLSGYPLILVATSSDAGGDLTRQRIDYLSPGSSEWVSGASNWAILDTSSQWIGSAASSHSLTCKFSPAISGTWQFRSQGNDAAGSTGSFAQLSLEVRPVTSESDSDGDGLPDYWEIAYGLNPLNASDRLGDPDGDGYTNLQEFGFGRNPKLFDVSGPLVRLRTSSDTTAGATIDSFTWRISY